MSVQFRNNLPRITSRLPKGASQVVSKTGFTVLGKSRIKCPKDTGLLANSLAIEFENDTKALIGTAVEYGPYVHDGTSRMEGNPFLAEAAEEEKRNFQKDLRNLDRSLK